eukprot:1160679-Pelagomonas_calceolata.AAC.2
MESASYTSFEASLHIYAGKAPLMRLPEQLHAPATCTCSGISLVQALNSSQPSGPGAQHTAQPVASRLLCTNQHLAPTLNLVLHEPRLYLWVANLMLHTRRCITFFPAPNVAHQMLYTLRCRPDAANLVLHTKCGTPMVALAYFTSGMADYLLTSTQTSI